MASIYTVHYNRRLIQAFLTVAFLFSPGIALAHQPRLVSDTVTVVSEPEVSKAFYGQLKGKPHTFTIDSSDPFELYVNILVPDVDGQQKNLVARVDRGNANGVTIVELRAGQKTWKHYWEEFGRSWYWQGPEFRSNVTNGKYTITVSSPENDQKYVLAIGEKEAFDPKEGLNALTLTPQLKRDFFLESPAGFLFSPFGYGLVLAMFALSAIFGFIYRALLKRIAKGKPQGSTKNIGKKDRWFRAILGSVLFLLAITTSWSPILLFFSGFCFFEAIFSWCGVYAAMGRNTCPRP